MNKMYSYFKAEALKIKHTFIIKLGVIAPIFTILLSATLVLGYFQMGAYNWWYTTILPGLISLVCTLAAVKDTKMKNRAVLSLPIDLKKIWAAKILICTAVITISSLILFLGTSLVAGVSALNKAADITAINAFAGILVLIITFLWQIPLCLFLGSKVGMFITIIISFAANAVLGILAATEKIWWAVPYAIPARLMCPILKVLPNGLPAVKGSETFKSELLSNGVILPGIIIAIVLFCILTIITARWYSKQEAK